jgi:hypothetical protein
VTAPAAEHGVNVPLLRRALDEITEKPETWDQGVWCGSACCLAGHVVALDGWEFIETNQLPGQFSRVTKDGITKTVPTAAADVLRIHDDQAEELFDGVNDLDDLWTLAARFTGGAVQLPAELRDRVTEIDDRNRAW